MEQKIRDYETFIKKAAQCPNRDLSLYHHRMLRYFQHERTIHLAVTLFFNTLTLIVIAFAAYLTIWYPTLWLSFLPLDFAALLLIILSAAYIRHYYFLENHIQKLYDYTRKLHNL